MEILSMKNISKIYKRKNRKPGFRGAIHDLISPNYSYIQAVNNINLTAFQGDIIGYVGRNGAGKSTTIKLMLGIIRKDNGTISYFGKKIDKFTNSFYSDIGAIFGQRSQLWWDISIQNSLLLLKEMYGVTKSDYNKRIEEINSFLDIKSLFSSSIRELSLGQKMKCEFASVFLHNPKMIIMDEATIGIDLIAKDSIRQMIKYFNKQYRTTFFMASHELVDLDKLCNKIFILDKGEMIYNGGIQELKDCFTSNEKTIIVKFKESVEIPQNTSNIQFQMRSINKFEVEIKYNKLNNSFSDIVNYFSETKNRIINDISIKEDDLEDVIKKIYESR